MRFDELAERRFAATLHLRPTTRLQYTSLLKKHLPPLFGEQAIGGITTLDVQTWIAHANATLAAASGAPGTSATTHLRA